MALWQGNTMLGLWKKSVLQDDPLGGFILGGRSKISGQIRYLDVVDFCRPNLILWASELRSAAWVCRHLNHQRSIGSRPRGISVEILRTALHELSTR